METIKLYSRYKDVETIFYPIDDTHGCIISNGNFVRKVISEDHETIEAIDFEGGPMLFLGKPIPGSDKKIKCIKSCYYVELE